MTWRHFAVLGVFVVCFALQLLLPIDEVVRAITESAALTALVGFLGMVLLDHPRHEHQLIREERTHERELHRLVQPQR